MVLSETSVPVIDLRDFDFEFEDEHDKSSSSSSSEKVVYQKLREACEEWGCFRIINHGIPISLMSDMKTLIRSLLDLPPDIKARNADVITGSGYVAPSPANPLYEALGLYDYASPEALRSFSDQLGLSPYQREIVEKYGRAVNELSLDIGKRMAKSLGLNVLKLKGWPWPCQFRINKYNFSDDTLLGSSGVQIHTDNSFLTILQEDEDVKGLEIITKNGQFLPVDPSPGTLLLNLGDIATNNDEVINIVMEESDNSKSNIPVIDMREFEDLLDSEKAYQKLREACEEWGCFRIINHGIPTPLMSEMKTVVRSLLDLPEEIKQRNTDVVTGSGYMAPSLMNPLYEGLGLYDFGSLEALNSFFDQLDASSYQRDVIEKYAKGVHEMAMDMGRKLAKSLGVKKIDPLKEWVCQFRINKYNFSPESVGSSGVQLHTDSGFLTVLQEDENVSGLEIMNKNGDFVPIEPCPGTLLLNLGDVAKAWSNGRFCNVKHRVQCKEASIRVSIASFLLGPKNGTVEIPQELVDDEHPRLYKPFIYEEYRSLRLSEKLHTGEALQFIETHNIA
ncbi:hypothetical protein G4B88_027336 [Cannabis sativa]|uniref:2-oxoglutarate-dependent dioxygenase DAO n=1 Tax=Cannabis sativa TaxID=3483 RepID=A0A7J6HQQ0_CANSA|nr:hypothetical protein G4B88_027336 [Cannabis sativa]